MRLKTKLGILVAATLLTLVGFNLMAAPSIDILKVGKRAGYEIISNYLAKAETAAPRSFTKG